MFDKGKPVLVLYRSHLKLIVKIALVSVIAALMVAGIGGRLKGYIEISFAILSGVLLGITIPLICLIVMAGDKNKKVVKGDQQ